MGALHYYEQCLGFTVDWGRDGGDIGGISQGARDAVDRQGRLIARVRGTAKDGGPFRASVSLLSESCVSTDD